MARLDGLTKAGNPEENQADVNESLTRKLMSEPVSAQTLTGSLRLIFILVDRTVRAAKEYIHLYSY
jgi:hypothetical protein